MTAIDTFGHCSNSTCLNSPVGGKDSSKTIEKVLAAISIGSFHHKERAGMSSRVLLAVVFLLVVPRVSQADVIVFDFVKNEVPPLNIPGATLQAVVDTSANTMVLNSFTTTHNNIYPVPQTQTLSFTAHEGSLATPWDVPDDGQSIIDAINTGTFAFVSDTLNANIGWDHDNIPVNQPRAGGTGRVAWGAHITNSSWVDDNAMAWAGWFDADDLQNRIAWSNTSFSAVPEPSVGLLSSLATVLLLYRRR